MMMREGGVVGRNCMLIREKSLRRSEDAWV